MFNGAGICLEEQSIVGSQRHGMLLRNGLDQAVCLPVEFEIAGDGAIMRGKGERLVMHYGASKTFRLIELIEQTLGRMKVLPDDEASRAYGIPRSENERHGKPISCGDLLIAAHAKSLGLTLVAKGREFSRVDGLRIEHFLEEEAG
jgi:PIN domain